MNSITKFIVATIALCIFQINTVFSQDFCIIANAGYSYRLMALGDTMSSSLESYSKKKKPGINYNIEVVWFNDNQGIGVRFNSFMNSVSGKNIQLSPVETVDKSEKIRINYWSLQYHNRTQIKETRLWIELSGGIGLVRYYNDGYELLEKISIIGKTYGLNGTVSCEYRIFKNFSFSFDAGIFIAVLSEYVRNGYTVILQKKEGLTRIDINGGLKIRF